MILPRSKVITFVFPSKIEKIVYLVSLNLLTRIYIQRINERYENLFLTKFFSQISFIVRKFIRFFKFIFPRRKTDPIFKNFIINHAHTHTHTHHIPTHVYENYKLYIISSRTIG